MKIVHFVHVKKKKTYTFSVFYDLQQKPYLKHNSYLNELSIFKRTNINLI